ncbi:hypothetical protein RHMOL_Rhmol02G0229200 [Rhododendron molle]|uniref:Uncharacterized protein n=1 Tax=Rhododendron molle TaxID=49168 RepID=A0ACC0PT99_RHOML|nr:hypothetical protein RHMOL_Rhmol02G0229200 [Rhododendron molle]
MGQPRSPAYADVPDGIDGKVTAGSGTTSSSVSPIHLDFVNFNTGESTFLFGNQLGSDPPNLVNTHNLSLGLNFIPKPTLLPAHSTNIAHQYYVTEPPDSPKSPSPKPLKPLAEPNTFSVSLSQSNSQITPNPSTLNHKTFTPIAGVSLAEVFNSLAIKHKAQDDADESHRAKILCLCAPDVKNTSHTNPLPIIKPTPRKNHSLPSKTKTPNLLRRSPRKAIPIPSPNRKGLDVGNTHDVEDALCKVFIEQESGGQNGDTRLVPTEVVRNYEEIGSALSKNGLGLMAGPKQPHPQC